MNKPHIIGINETKLDHTVIDGEVEIDEYQMIRNDRNSFGGGVALYIHDKVPFRDWSLLIPGTGVEGNIIFSPKNS